MKFDFFYQLIDSRNPDVQLAEIVRMLHPGLKVLSEPIWNLLEKLFELKSPHGKIFLQNTWAPVHLQYNVAHLNSEWLTQIECSFEFLIIWLRADGDDAAAYDDADDADAPNYPVLLHPEKPEQEVAVCPTVVDVRLKMDQ